MGVRVCACVCIFVLVCMCVPFWKTIFYQLGVVNVVNGDGSTCVFLAEHMDVDKICFTGSSAVGRKIVQMSAASNMKKVTLEFCGKSPMIVCDDADLDQAVTAAGNGLFFNAGQCCCASSRLLVQDAIYDVFFPQSSCRNFTHCRSHICCFHILGSVRWSDLQVKLSQCLGGSALPGQI